MKRMMDKLMDREKKESDFCKIKLSEETPLLSLKVDVLVNKRAPFSLHRLRVMFSKIYSYTPRGILLRIQVLQRLYVKNKTHLSAKFRVLRLTWVSFQCEP